MRYLTGKKHQGCLLLRWERTRSQHLVHTPTIQITPSIPNCSPVLLQGKYINIGQTAQMPQAEMSFATVAGINNPKSFWKPPVCKRPALNWDLPTYVLGLSALSLEKDELYWSQRVNSIEWYLIMFSRSNRGMIVVFVYLYCWPLESYKGLPKVWPGGLVGYLIHRLMS